MTALLVLVPLVPLGIAGVIAFAGRRGAAASGWLALAGTVLALTALVILAGSSLRATATWMRIGAFTFTVGLEVDGLSMAMALLVAAITLLVDCYAISYMADDADRPRFFAWMSFFTASMLALVLASSLTLLFIAWESVGVASWALIAHRVDEEASRRAAFKAFVVTRLGDLGLVLGWLLALVVVGSTDLDTLVAAARAHALADGLPLVLSFLFLIAVVAKSAQLPLCTWLPDAMAAPTPVSALLHSATMVAAGIYLVLRLYPIFAASEAALAALRWGGGATALTAALVATSGADVKRILAWSTVSQLGEMLLALGLGGPIAAALHLMTHAVYKSALFLTAGAVDRAAGTRALDRLGGLGRAMPWSAAVFAVAALALAGLPPLAGFVSEDEILRSAARAHLGWALLVVVLIFLAGVYISRLGAAIFGQWPGAPSAPARDPSWLMRAPMLVLAAAAIGIGWALRGPLAHVLPLPASSGSLDWSWRGGAIAASIAGLALGWARVRTAGAAAPFGAWPRVIDRGLGILVDLPAQATQWLGEALAGKGRFAERGLEPRLDALARLAATASLGAAAGVDRVESVGFGAGGDVFARAIDRAGGLARRAQSGRVYLYTMSIFLFMLLALVASLALW